MTSDEKEEVWDAFRCVHCQNGWVFVLDPPSITRTVDEDGKVTISTTRKLRHACDCSKNKDKS